MATEQRKKKGSRIYNQVDYGVTFEGSAKEKGFETVAALDQSAAIQKQAQQKGDNIRNLAEAARRQGQLDNVTLAGNQKIAQAQHTAGWATVKGILSLTQTGLKAYETVHKAREDGKKENDLLNSIGYFEQVPEPNEQEVTEIQDDELHSNAESTAVIETSNELKQEGGIENESTAHVLQESTTYNLTKGIKGSVYGARASHQAYLASYFSNLPPGEKPKTIGEANILLRQANRLFLKESGLLDPRLKALLVTELAPTMTANSANQAATLVASGIQADQKANVEAAKSLVSTLVDSGKSIEEIWSLVDKEYLTGNHGYADKAAATQAGLTQLLEELSLQGHEGRAKIEQLRTVLKRPGVKGTELEKNYAHLFDKYEEKSDDVAAKNWTRKRQIEAGKLSQIVEDYYKNPTPENKEQAILALQQQKTPASIKLANELLATGLGYDPAKYTELRIIQSKGTELDEGLLRNLLNEEVISKDEYQKLTTSGPFAQTKKEIKTHLDKLDDTIFGRLVKDVPPALRTPEFNGEARIRVEAVKERIYNHLMNEARVDNSLLSDKGSLARLTTEVLERTVNLPEFTATQSPTSQWSFQDGFNTQKTKYDVVGKTGIQDWSRGSYEDLFEGGNNYRGLMQPSKDFFFSADRLKTLTDRFLTDGTFSDELKTLSKTLGYTPKAFLNAQLRSRGLPSLKHININSKTDQTVEPNLSDINFKFKHLTSELGLPWEGGAYLAANLNAENGEVGEKGLISWAPWHNTDARVAAIEKHFGKSVDQITEAEQVSYILVEMEKNYPEAYRIFKNPRSSKADLRKASALYFGYEDPGIRYNYADSLIKQGRI